MASGSTVPAFEDAPLAPPPSEEGWPLVLFSHGLFGNRRCYSCELPSCLCTVFLELTRGRKTVRVPFQNVLHSLVATSRL